jgi:arsenate reductase
MLKKKVLFVCIHNSARSQMSEELLRKLAGDRFEADSAGLEPGLLNPFVIETLKEDGIDITGKQTKAVIDLLKKGNEYSYVITVCDETSAEKCPIFPGQSQRLHWSFTDPSKFDGSPEEKLAKTKKVKEEIRRKIEQWLQTVP